MCVGMRFVAKSAGTIGFAQPLSFHLMNRSLLGRSAASPMPAVIDLRQADDHRDVVHRAVETLAAGKLVAFPTETVYGLAASARDAAAVARLQATKGDREGKPFTLAIKSANDALDYVPNMSPLTQRLARRCWPGPITLVTDANHEDSLLASLPDEVRQLICPDGTLGLRVPAHQTILECLQISAGPLVLTSANRASEPAATDASTIVSSLGDQVDLVLDDGPSRYGQPSSVVLVNGQEWKILRAGVVGEAMLNRLSSLMVLFVCTGNTCRSPMAEALCRKLIAERLEVEPSALEDSGVIVMSAGVAAFAGGQASPEAIAVMEEKGISIAQHESQPLSDQLVRHADLILTMTQSHRQTVVQRWPDAACRTKLLRFDGQDVSDPIGGPHDVYRRCADQMGESLIKLVEQLEFN